MPQEKAMYYLLAWRNIWRNKRRSLITILSITFAVLLACVMRSMQLGSYSRMIENSVRFYTGHIQLHKNGYWKDKIIDNSFDYDSLLQQKVRQVSGVTWVVPRVESFALASFNGQSKGALVLGAGPELENELTHIKEKVIKGKFISTGEDGILIGEGLAEYLNADVGDTITLIGQGYHGVNAAGLFPIRGIVRFPLPAQNNQMIYMDLPRAQWLYGMPGMITSFALLIDHPGQTDRIVSQVKEQIDPKQIEVMGWKELVPELLQSIELDNISGKVMLWILYFVIGFGMFGTFLMMTAERRYEFGVMLAVGMRRLRLQTLIALEIFMMTVAGVLTGITIAFPILAYFHFNPIHYGAEAAKAIESFGVEAVYPFSLDSVVFTNQAYAILIMAFLMSGYPLWTIQRMTVVESMRS